MPKLNQRGVIHLLVPLILLIGIIAGVYLIQNRTNLFPKASVSGPLTPQTSFTLFPSKSNYVVGEAVEVKLLVHSDIAAANLFNAKISYDPTQLKFERIDTTGTFITNWVEQYYNDPGKVSLVGGVPAPGIQTQVSDNTLMATLIFTAQNQGTATISFDETAAIYSNADNVNILTSKEPANIAIVGSHPSAPPTPSSSPVPTPTGDPSPCLMMQQRIEAAMWSTCTDTNYDPVADANKDRYVNSLDMSFLIPRTDGLRNQTACAEYLEEGSNPCLSTPLPSVTPVPGSGDGNRDGKVDLIDLSVLLSDFNKNSGFRTSIDLNGDGVINTFDFSLMRNLLIQKGVIKG